MLLPLRLSPGVIAAKAGLQPRRQCNGAPCRQSSSHDGPARMTGEDSVEEHKQYEEDQEPDGARPVALRLRSSRPGSTAGTGVCTRRPMPPTSSAHRIP